MTIFNNYFKIVKQHKFSMLIYVVLFSAMSILFTSFESPAQQVYSSHKADITIVNEDNSEYSQRISDYLSEVTTVKEISADHLDDALFNQEIDSIVTLPAGFKSHWMVEVRSRPDDLSTILVNQNLNAFISTFNLYLSRDYSMNEAYQMAKEDMSQSVSVEIVENPQGGVVDEPVLSYFNFLNYILLAQMILIVALIMKTYKKQLIKFRHHVSSLRPSSLNGQLTLGHMTIGVGIWLIYMIVFLVLFRDRLDNPAVFLMILNSFVFMISTIALAVLIGTAIVNENSISVVTNVYALGVSFISGAFVPVDLLPDFTLKLSQVTPSYYYIQNNHRLMENAIVGTMLPNVLIMLGFTVLFIVITMIVNNARKKA